MLRECSQLHRVMLMSMTLLSGCTSDSKLQPHRINLGLLDDRSISASQNCVPQILPEHVDSLLAICQRHGGSLSFLAVTEQSFRPLLRINLHTPRGTLKEKALVIRRQREHMIAFREEVAQITSSERTARVTDLWGGLHRFDRLLREPERYKDSLKIMLIASDGIDDARRWPPVQLPDDVLVIAVGLSSQANITDVSPNIYQFESLDSAINYIKYSLYKGA